MTTRTIEEFVGQAESGGVTLAQVLSSELSAQELDRLQADLTEMISNNYRSIEDFMSDVAIPSIAGLSNLTDSELDEFQSEINEALSDGREAAHC